MENTLASPVHNELRRKLSESGRNLLRWSLEGEDDFSDLLGGPEQPLEHNPNHGPTSSVNPVNLSTNAPPGENFEETKERLDHAFDLIIEKKANLRVDALELIIEVLSNRVSHDLIGQIGLSLLPEIQNIVRKRSSNQEMSLALRAISIIALTVGADEDAFYHEMAGTLDKVMKTNKDEETRTAALNTLAHCCVFCSSDTEETWGLIDVCASIFAKQSDEISDESRQAAVDCWALLVSTLDLESLESDFLEEDQSSLLRHAKIMNNLFETPSIDLKVSAGEAFALLAELRATLDETWSVEEEPEDSPFLIALDALQENVTETNKRVSKKGKKNLRSAFRVILRTLEDHVSPVVDIQMKNLAVTLSSWIQIKQYNELKKILQTGFQEHFENNPLVQEILSHGQDDMSVEDTRTAKKDKRAIQSKSSAYSKQKSVNLRNQRRAHHDARFGEFY